MMATTSLSNNGAQIWSLSYCFPFPDFKINLKCCALQSRIFLPIITPKKQLFTEIRNQTPPKQKRRVLAFAERKTATPRLKPRGRRRRSASNLGQQTKLCRTQIEESPHIQNRIGISVFAVPKVTAPVLVPPQPQYYTRWSDKLRRSAKTGPFLSFVARCLHFWFPWRLHEILSFFLWFLHNVSWVICGFWYIKRIIALFARRYV